jgi:phosphoribosyl 1,2-cyclic phosphate phosphodiesterase
MEAVSCSASELAVMKVTILGCGGSGGVPLIGPDWGRCNPDNPKNRRRRVSILIQYNGANIVCDTSPDFRAQMLDAGVGKLDAILYTHDHADHTQGIDDVRFMRSYEKGQLIPAYGAAGTLETLTARFPYIFQQGTEGSGHLYKPFLEPRLAEKPFELAGLTVTPFEQSHGFGSKTLGYRIGPAAYSTDAVELPEEAFEILAGLDLWVVDCLRFEPHVTHAHFDKVMGWIDRLKPKHAILTHMNHMVDYDVIRAKCPPGVEPGYDGLAVEIPPG